MMRIGTHPRRTDHPALVADDGTPITTFAAGATREEIAEILARFGFLLNEDDTVTKAVVS